MSCYGCFVKSPCLSESDSLVQMISLCAVQQSSESELGKRLRDACKKKTNDTESMSQQMAVTTPRPHPGGPGDAAQ